MVDKQVEQLEKSVEYTNELFILNHNTSYLEVLTAQQPSSGSAYESELLARQDIGAYLPVSGCRRRQIIMRNAQCIMRNVKD